MTIQIVSTTDSQESINQALGGKTQTEAVETKEAAQEETSESTEPTEAEASATQDDETQESEESEEENSEELEAKDSDEEEIEEEKPKKKSGFQKRVDKLNKKLAAKDQEIEFLKKHVINNNNNPGQKIENKDQKTSDLTTRPKADDFATNDEYIEALADWKLDQKLLARDQKQKEEAAINETQKKITTHNERVAEFTKSHDDWDEVIESVGDIPLSVTFQEAILDSEMGPALMYELGKNPEELKRICKLGPVQAAMALGKIEARLTKPSESSVTKTKTSKAPAPVQPVRTKGAVVVKDIYDPELPFKDFERLRNERLRPMRR